ncbi:MAG: P-II family nitrogen regulator [Candidatus Nitrosothermus koennekii]|nr:MAG: P-II family nitrogen regulator [Candidatus Nitrosothermus koennekii]
MKKVEIIVPHRLVDDITQITKDMNIGGMSVTKIEGRGRVKAQPIATGRGTKFFIPDFIPRTKIEIVVKDEQVEPLINKILDELGGDPNMGGKIFVTDVVTAADLVKKTRDEAAI